MSEIKREQILNILKSILHPGKGTDIVSLHMVQGLVIKDGEVGFALNINPAEAEQMEQVRKECDAKLLDLSGVDKVVSVLTAERDPTKEVPPSQPHGHKPHAPHTSKGASAVGNIKKIPGVKHIIAVASGKGGVGKSTTAVNLALALQTLGLKTGIFDVDIYGPSIPTMLGVTHRPTQNEDKKIVPIIKHGLVSMSLGYLMKQDTATIWRGPMVMGAVKQMIDDTLWDVDGPLDVLVLDLPPGTGDVQLTLAQNVYMDGAIVVSTPQDIALIDARKGLDMFKKTNTTVFGIVENMSYFLCPSCGDRSDIFGHGGAREVAKELGMDFLGEIPLHMDIRSTSDAGTPIVIHDPQSPHTAIYLDIARKIEAKLQ
ncbi:MAG: Mrp/NBP35 family ATP-binding protein [Emcibacter sp.]|nr:Mrp/NBP35 family ATP-binding protein [Emcibacter sp.]